MRLRLLPTAGAARLVRRLAAALAVGAFALPAALYAQDPDTTLIMNDSAAVVARTFEVSAVTGYQWFDRSAALEGAPMIGVRILNPRIVPAIPGVHNTKWVARMTFS